jgi:hypothetical protein
MNPILRFRLKTKCFYNYFPENFPNEERTWEEIMQIKAMPVSMAQKRDLKAKLQVITAYYIFFSILLFILIFYLL